MFFANTVYNSDVFIVARFGCFILSTVFFFFIFMVWSKRVERVDLENQVSYIGHSKVLCFLYFTFVDFYGGPHPGIGWVNTIAMVFPQVLVEFLHGLLNFLYGESSPGHRGDSNEHPFNSLVQVIFWVADSLMGSSNAAEF